MNFNKAFILGNLVADPEARMTPSGTAVANFRVATNRVFKDKTGQKQEQAEFHNVVAWGRQAEIVREYLKRGRLVFVEGRLQTRSWEGQDGQKRWRTEIIAEMIQLGPRPAGSGSSMREASAAPAESPSKPKADLSAAASAKTEDIPVIDEDTPVTFEDEEPKEVDPKEIPF